MHDVGRRVRSGTEGRRASIVAHAYRQLESETDRQFAVLTDPRGPYRLKVVGTKAITPYAGAGELIASKLHGEVSALWATGGFAEHKAVLLDRQLLQAPRSEHDPGPRREFGTV